MTQQVMATDDFLEEYFEHHGVKGMKWGQRKVTTKEIHAARRRVDSQVRTIQAQEDKVTSAKGKASKAKAEKKLNEMNVAFLKNPDRATSIRLTRGEKAAHVALAVLFPTVGTAVAVASAGSRATTRKVIENRQASGHYNKK